MGSRQRILNIGGHLIRFSCKADDLVAMCEAWMEEGAHVKCPEFGREYLRELRVIRMKRCKRTETGFPGGFKGQLNGEMRERKPF